MKAIQIFDVNRELLETWGESEELTWTNSFGNLIGSVLVVDDELPQGYGVRTASSFWDEYVWVSNFGTQGWSEIKKVSDKETVTPKEQMYKVTLTDESGSVPHEIARGAVGNFINNIDWAQVYAFSVEPIEMLAQWEIELMNSANE